MLNGYIENIVKSCGPRVPGSEEETKAVEITRNILSGTCDKVDIEAFNVAPRVLQRLTELTAYAFIAMFILFFISPIFSLLIASTNLGIVVLSRWYDFDLVEKYMEKRTSHNLIGIIKPADTTKRRFIVSGHIDSAFNMPLLSRRFVWLTPILEVFSTLTGVVMAFISVYAMSRGKWIFPYIPNKIWSVSVLIGFAGVIATQIMRKGLVTDKAVDGANDNLSGVAVAVGFAEYLKGNKPKNTEVMCIAFGSEEPNTKGSQAFVKKHIGELKSIPTYVLNFDMIGEDGTLRIIKREMEVHGKHSAEFVNFVNDAGNNAHINNKPSTLPFGNTDATPFSRKGIQATSIIRLDSTGLPGHWHNFEDTIKNIREESLTEALELAKAVLTKLDV